MPLEIADIVVIIVLLVSGLLAYFRGLVREVLSLATWIGAALVTMYSFPHVQPYVRDFISVKIAADIVTGVALFVAALIVLTLLNHVISGRVKDSALGALDRGLGFLFGLARGALLITVAYIAATWFWDTSELSPYIGKARATPYVQQGAALLRRIVPKEIQSDTKSAAEGVRKKADQAVEAKQQYEKLQENGILDKPKSYDQKERSGMQRLLNSNQ